MTAREQDGADNMIREMADRKAHWYRVRVFVGVMVFGLLSLLGLIQAVAWIAHRLGGVQ